MAGSQRATVKGRLGRGCSQSTAAEGLAAPGGDAPGSPYPPTRPPTTPNARSIRVGDRTTPSTSSIGRGDCARRAPLPIRKSWRTRLLSTRRHCRRGGASICVQPLLPVRSKTRVVVPPPSRPHGRAVPSSRLGARWSAARSMARGRSRSIHRSARSGAPRKRIITMSVRDADTKRSTRVC